MQPADFSFVETSSNISLMFALTEAAKEFMSENFPKGSFDYQFWGDALVVENRYVIPLVEALYEGGYQIRLSSEEEVVQ
ncbi:MAG: hypothetical protein EBS90_07060 [Betaproteobacteria bacterium]|nr:hypothetical protein [Betaproteobacteria bacterium]